MSRAKARHTSCIYHHCILLNLPVILMYNIPQEVSEHIMEHIFYIIRREPWEALAIGWSLAISLVEIGWFLHSDWLELAETRNLIGSETCNLIGSAQRHFLALLRCPRSFSLFLDFSPTFMFPFFFWYKSLLRRMLGLPLLLKTLFLWAWYCYLSVTKKN